MTLLKPLDLDDYIKVTNQLLDDYSKTSRPWADKVFLCNKTFFIAKLAANIDTYTSCDACDSDLSDEISALVSEEFGFWSIEKDRDGLTLVAECPWCLWFG